MTVHYVIGNKLPQYACGVGNRWSSQDITGSRSPDAVTCRSCQQAIANPRNHRARRPAVSSTESQK